jgi:hypothetical protein
MGLARLLVLEKFPKTSDREAYLDQRRRERGRPAVNRSTRFSRQLKGNIKNDWDDEVAEWVEQDEVSDYHTFVSPTSCFHFDMSSDSALDDPVRREISRQED